jgi:hypothetical protein
VDESFSRTASSSQNWLSAPLLRLPFRASSGPPSPPPPWWRWASASTPTGEDGSRTPPDAVRASSQSMPQANKALTSFRGVSPQPQPI